MTDNKNNGFRDDYLWPDTLGPASKCRILNRKERKAVEADLKLRGVLEPVNNVKKQNTGGFARTKEATKEARTRKKPKPKPDDPFETLLQKSEKKYKPGKE